MLEVAKENAARGGRQPTASRRVPGSAFDVDCGRDHALVLLTNFLHHFDPKDVRRRCSGASTPRWRPAGGRSPSSSCPTRAASSPPEAAVFSLTMLATTPAGDAYTLREYQEMFRAAGFSDVSLA